MYKIKQIPEDFHVKEIIDLRFDQGRHSYYLLKKKGYTTFKAVDFLSKKIGIPIKNIGFAGAKDSKAITEQAISIYNGPTRDFRFNNIELKFLGRGKERIVLGSHKGNYFEIVIRNITKKPRKIKKMVNYFDEQRFSEKNWKIGRNIVFGDFKNAIELIAKTNIYKRGIKEHLEKNPNDYIGAISRIPKKLLRLYVNAYQSYIWNKTAIEYLKQFKCKKLKSKDFVLIFPVAKIKNVKIPVIGFATGLKEDKIGKTIKKILKREKITNRDFIIKSIPHISSEGGVRDLIVKIKNLKIGKFERDEMNKGKNKIRLSFSLQKGSYATMLIKQLFL